MTCFWIGILSLLELPQSTDYIVKFIQFLKNNNTPTTHILCNDVHITEKQIIENTNAIKELDERTIHNGYLCSTFDPVLFLVCELFKISIHHNYHSSKICYTNTLYNQPNHIYKVSSDLGHFWRM